MRLKINSVTEKEEHNNYITLHSTYDFYELNRQSNLITKHCAIFQGRRTNPGRLQITTPPI